MYAASQKQVQHAEAVILRLQDMADSEEVDSKPWAAAVLAANGLQGWLEVARSGEVRRSLKEAIASEHVRFTERSLDVPQWFCHEIRLEFVA